jgi:hypothetical protein
MVMLNYFFFKSDFLQIGYFDENSDDETLMTRRLENLGISNFCTNTSYIEHIGQHSILNQWRQTKTSRSVFGMNLVTGGWPSELNQFNTLGCYKDLKVSQSIGAESSLMPISVVFVVTTKDYETLIQAVDAARKNLAHPIDDIYVVAPSVDKLVNFSQENDLIFIDENSVLKTKKGDIEYRDDERRDRSGWLFQQLLKYGVAQFISTEHYLVIDADTILIKPQRFDVNGRPLLLHSDEFNEPYFRVLERLLGIHPKILLSCVSHHMLFTKKYLSDMLTFIEDRHLEDWETAILNCVDYSNNSGFSEYETYGQWCMTKYPNEIEREYWFNLAMPRKNLNRLDALISEKSKIYRSISFHSYLE